MKEIRLRYELLKLISSDVDSTPTENARVATQVFEGLQSDAYFADVGIVQDDIRTFGYVKYIRNSLEMHETVAGEPYQDC